MNYTQNRMDFFKILQEKDPTLAGYFENVKNKGLEDWVHLLTPELGSHAGYPHLRNVERIANLIVPDDVKRAFNPSEIFLLLNAIFLHDIGKTISPLQKPIARCNQASKCRTMDKYTNIPLCYTHKYSHFALGESMIRNQGIALGLPDERIAQYCGLIVFCHGLILPPTVDQPVTSDPNCKGKWLKQGDYRSTSLALYGEIRIPLLASILRIADETDDSWNRALRDYWFRQEESKSTNLGKAFRRYIEDIEFCHDGKCLVIHIPAMSEETNNKDLMKKYIESINKVRNDIQMVIRNWGLELNKIGVYFNEVYFEYKGHLCTNLDPIHEAKSWPSLSTVVSERNRKSVREIYDALVELSLGSCNYPKFTWETLEAQIGRPLTGVDKWLTHRIADISDNHITIDNENEIRVEIRRDEVSRVRLPIYA